MKRYYRGIYMCVETPPLQIFFASTWESIPDFLNTVTLQTQSLKMCGLLEKKASRYDKH